MQALCTYLQQGVQNQVQIRRCFLKKWKLTQQDPYSSLPGKDSHDKFLILNIKTAIVFWDISEHRLQNWKPKLSKSSNRCKLLSMVCLNFSGYLVKRETNFYRWKYLNFFPCQSVSLPDGRNDYDFFLEKNGTNLQLDRDGLFPWTIPFLREYTYLQVKCHFLPWLGCQEGSLSTSMRMSCQCYSLHPTCILPCFSKYQLFVFIISHKNKECFCVFSICDIEAKH